MCLVNAQSLLKQLLHLICLNRTFLTCFTQKRVSAGELPLNVFYDTMSVAYTGATFDTPFFIRPKESRRALWFVHLSRHPIARDVMINCHWNSFNKFEHYGSGGFDMLGWDAILDGSTVPLFNFTEMDRDSLRRQLLDSMPEELYALVSESPATVDVMHHRFANSTAGRFSDLDEVVLELCREGEFDVLGRDGQRRTRGMKRLHPTDLISFPRSPMFPFLSRLKRS